MLLRRLAGVLVAVMMVAGPLLVSPGVSRAAAVDWTGDTVISDVRSYTGDTITLTGNLTITGSLTLSGTELAVDCPSCGTYSIDVDAGGTLNILAGSKVHAVDSAAPFLFRVWQDAALTMNDSELHGCGWGGGVNFDVTASGLYVSSSNVSITNSTLSENFVGLFVDNSSAPFIGRSNISDNGVTGIWVSGGSSPVIDNNSICRNDLASVWGKGIRTEYSSPVITNNTISHNGGLGIEMNGGTAIIGHNEIHGSVVSPFSQNEGIRSWDANNTIYSNNCSGNTIGLEMDGGSSSVRENVFDDNVGDSVYVGDGYGVLDGSSSAFENNSYSGNRCGVSLCGCDSTFENESIESSSRGGVEYYEQGHPFSAVMTNCSFSKNVCDVMLQTGFGNGWGGTLDMINPIASGLLVSVDEPLATLKVSWYLRTQVIYENGSRPVEGAYVNVTDAFSARAATLVTAADGWTDNVLLEAYTMTGYGSVRKTPFNISAVKDTRHNFTDDVHLTASGNATVMFDDVPPPLELLGPQNGTLTNKTDIFVEGTTEREATVLVDDLPATVDANGDWLESVHLPNEGANDIVAIAADPTGNLARASLTVFRDTIAPVLDLTAPLDGLLTDLSSVTVAGSVSDIRADTAVNGRKVMVGPDGAFSAAVNLTEGANTITVESRDAAGNLARATRTVVMDSIPPMLALLQPPDGFLTAQDSVTIRGAADTDSTVTVNGQPVDLESGDFVIRVALQEGTNVFTFVARDNAGNENRSLLTIIRDSTPPVIELSSPSDGQVVNRTEIEVRGTTEAGAALAVNGRPVQLAGTAFCTTVRLLEGGNTITVEASDFLGNTARLEVSVTLDTVAPALDLTSPKNGTLTNRTAIEVCGTSERGVTVQVNDIIVQPDGSGAFAVMVNLTDEGANRIRVTAWDAACNTAVAGMTVLRDTILYYNITAPKNGTTTRNADIVVSGDVEPEGSVTIGNISVAPGADGRFSRAVPLVPGPNNITISFRDKAGNSARLSLTVYRKSTANPTAKKFIPGFDALLLLAALAVALLLTRKRV